MSTRLIIPGQRATVAGGAVRGATAAGVSAPVTRLLHAVEVVASFNLSPGARARTAAPQTFDALEGDILEIEVEGGFKLWTSPERYREEVARLRPESVAADGSVMVDTLPRASASERGVKEWFQSALSILRMGKDAIADDLDDPSKWPDDFKAEFGVRVVSDLTAWLGSKLVMRLIEGHLNPGPGLYRWDDAVTPRPRADRQDTATFGAGFDPGKPVLVFIHGTASSTVGSFGAFLAREAQPHWQALRAFFGEQVYAFEHRTMSESPIENAIQLVGALPPRANLYLVSHSRGGLVGDLVCLRAMDAGRIAQYRRKETKLQEADAWDRKKLAQLAALLAEKELRVKRFVRCASPARGTLLASENIDTFMSVLTNLVGLIPGLAGSPLYEVVKRTALQIVKNRTGPELVPGVEAMMPSSPLVAFLNAAGQEANGLLGVVAGDIEGGSWLKRLGVFLTDHAIYESRDNDLVVNTDSMFHGARRGTAYYVFDQGADVSHFNYFKNERTRAALAGFLAAPEAEAPPAFNRLPEDEIAPVPMLRSLQARAGAAQPIVFVLPGIMGSQLAAGDQDIWLNYIALAMGGLGRIADLEARTVKATALVGDYYRSLCEYLANSHEVIPFAYDWRRSVRDTAVQLAAEVEKALARSGQPVRLLAHSMGGLVARAMIAEKPDLWEEICKRDGGRLVLLGTPNRGSHAMVEALLGTATTIRHLALLDVRHRTREITAIIAGFPGVLELLPHEETFFLGTTWVGYQNVCLDGAVPAAGLLGNAKQSTDRLAADAPLQHADRVLYVAGTSPHTVTKVEVTNGQLVLEATTEGDGRVTYQSGRLPGVSTWYVNAEHGDLASHEPAFPAILDLLDRGTTARLGTQPLSVARGDEAIYRTVPEPVLYPTRASLTAGLMGQRLRRPHKKPAAAGFRVSVVHGDLRYASHAVMVGHYLGDTIVGAEWQMDRLLDGALSNRYNLGLYPGEFGSVAVVLREPSALQRALGLPHGAVVVGLGKWGDLTAAQLANLIRRAALQYTLQLDDAAAVAEAGAPRTAPVDRGLSILLMGGNSTANISTEDSVGAILRGIAQANREIDASPTVTARINEIEVIELFADTAIEAAHAAKRIAKAMAEELGMPIDAAPLLRRGREGRTRITPPTALREPWRRWEISVVRPPETSRRPALAKPLADRLKRAIAEAGDADPELVAALADLALADAVPTPEPHRVVKFISLSERARAEVIQQQRQPELIERLIRDSVGRTAFRAQEARALFQLMIPNDLKGGLAHVARVVFVVDADTAAYPWELLMDGEEPLCTRMGMVRQLQTAHFRAHIRATTARTAFVVGDPIVSPPYQQLAGARTEAAAVNDLLKTRFDVTYRPESLGALEVLGGLYERPYRIVHLAGHGQYEASSTEDGKARSGMVLDNGVFLTAVEIGQMQQVPELVFLNCCHIGQTGPEASGTEFNRLAAGISRELIEMGVRAVVAAGWAVRDDAALYFARCFYQHMLDGDTFGNALQHARTQTWRQPQFKDCNTWGAYQAYGDPDFRFDLVSAGAAPGEGTLVAPDELIDALTGLRREAREIERTAGDPGREREAKAQRLDALVKGCPPEWLQRSDVAMELGYTYGELRRFEDATRYLVLALEAEGVETSMGSSATLQAVEQLSNFEARLAEGSAGDGSDPATVEQSVHALKRSIERLKRLLDVAKTSERYSMLGSAYKRLASVDADVDAARESLRRAAESYERAHAWDVAHGRFNPYPVVNWLSSRALLGETVPDSEILLARVEAAGRERFARAREFFDAVAIPDSELYRAVATGALAGGPQGDSEMNRLVGRYLETFKLARPSAREIDSVTTQIALVERLLRKFRGGEPGTEATCAALASLRAAIGGGAPASAAERPTPARPSPPAPARRATGPRGARRKRPRSRRATR
jgi:CHAT domain-containing protein/esterase/lipase superfamily enzyme